MEARPLTTAEVHTFVETLDYPMFVVTASDGVELSGCLVGFATQTSIDPPRFLACLSDKNHTTRVARAADVLAVHVLSAEQHDLAALFGGETGDATDKFARCAWRAGPGGVPLLDDCPARLVGRVLERFPLGDHIGFLLEPIAVEGATQAAQGGSDEDVLTLDDVDDVEPGHQA